MKPTVVDAIAKFGKTAKAKLGNPSASGEPEDQLRAPFEQLLGDMASLSGFAPGVVTSLRDVSLRRNGLSAVVNAAGSSTKIRALSVSARSSAMDSSALNSRVGSLELDREELGGRAAAASRAAVAPAVKTLLEAAVFAFPRAR